MLALSLWVRSDSGLWVYVENLSIERYYWACYFGMAAGSLLSLIAFSGCLGALLDSHLVIGIVSSHLIDPSPGLKLPKPNQSSQHTLLSITALICEIILLVFVFKGPMGDRLQNELSFELKYHIDSLNHDAKSRNFLDLIQLKLQCCGAYSFVDYKNMRLPVPQSCSNDLTNNINYRSCGEMLRRFLEIRGGIMGGLALALVLLQSITTGLSLVYLRITNSNRAAT